MTVVTTENHGVAALLLSMFFGPVGAFFSWWLLGEKSFLYSFMFALLYFVLLAISGVLVYLAIGFILVPVIWIIMIYHCYKSCSHPHQVVQTIKITNNQ